MRNARQQPVKDRLNETQSDWIAAGNAGSGAERVCWLRDDGRHAEKPFSLDPLTPANYNTPFGIAAFQAEAQKILDEIKAEIGWMYETLHTDGRYIAVT